MVSPSYWIVEGWLLLILATLDIVTVSGKWIVIFNPDNVWLIYGKIVARKIGINNDEWWMMGVGNRYIFCGHCFTISSSCIWCMQYMFTIHTLIRPVSDILHCFDASTFVDFYSFFIWFIHSYLFPVSKTTTIALTT